MSNLIKRRVVFTLLLLAGINFCSFAQSNAASDNAPQKIKAYRMPSLGDYDTWDISGFFGLTYASTDIGGSNMGFGSKQMVFGLDVTKYLSHSFGVQLRAMTGGLKGIDDERNLFQFKTTINYDVTLNGVFQIGNLSFLSHKRQLAFYATVGAGVINYTPKVSIDGGKTELNGIYSQYTQPYEYPDYKSSSDLVIPFGAGLKYHASKKLSVFAEYNFRTTQSDKLDGFFKLLSADDHYSCANVGVVYHLGKQNKPIEWANPLQALYDDYIGMKEKIDLLGVDNDNDGVVDLFDREPDTKPGAKVYGDGKAVDTDGDGIPDISDADPYSNMKVKVDASGQAIDNAALKTKDSDGDGVPDYMDVEPNSRFGARVDASGKEIVVTEAVKTTEDKVDKTDASVKKNTEEAMKKADEAVRKAEEATRKAEEAMRKADEATRKAEASGKEVSALASRSKDEEKPPYKEPVMEKKAPAEPVNEKPYVPEPVVGTPSDFDLPTVYFGRDQDQISSKFNDELISFGLLMHNNPSLNFVVIGNCDTKGSVAYNNALGKRRAEAVKSFLVNRCKVDANRLTTETTGKQNLIDGVGEINRRVDIRIR